MYVYVYQEFPKWKYNRTLPACIVQGAEAEAALGPGWADSPAAFTDSDQREAISDQKPETPAPVAANAPVRPPIKKGGVKK